jgi:hypothetical protein
MKTVTLYTDGACEAVLETCRWHVSGRVEISAKHNFTGAVEVKAS